MNVQVTSRPTAQAPANLKLAIADGDIHPQRNSYKDLLPYMEARWLEQCEDIRLPPAAGLPGGPRLSEGPAQRLAP